MSFNLLLILNAEGFVTKAANFRISTDATAAFSIELKNAAVNLIWPVIADQLLTTEQWVSSFSKGRI